VLIVSCFPIAIIVNALRVSATGVLANYYGLSVAEGFFHGFSGYVLFLVAFLLLLALGYLLSAIEKASDSSMV
jgi:exosortase/archaeosortase family protein